MTFPMSMCIDIGQFLKLFIMSKIKFDFNTQVLVTDDSVQISACYSESFCSSLF